MGLGDGADLLQLQDAPGVTHVGLHVIHQVALAELRETVLGEGALPGCQRHFRFLAQVGQFLEVFDLRRLFHKERPQVLDPRAELHRHHRSQLAVGVDADVEVVSNRLTRRLQLAHALAHRAAAAPLTDSVW